QPDTLSRDVDVARADRGIHAAVARTGVVIVADDREGHHTTSARRHTDGRIGQVVVGQGQRPLQGQAATCRARGYIWLDDEVLEGGFVDTVHNDVSVERAPDLAIGVHHLLHAGVVAIQVGYDLGERIGDAEQDSRRAGRNVQTLSLRPVAGGRLIRLRRD